MINEPRTYRHPAFQIVLTIIIFGLMAFFLLVVMDIAAAPIFIPLAILVMLIALYSVYALTSRTTISETEISTQNILGTRSLRWHEIHRVSGSGYRLKLHNFDGDVTVAPSPQLPGYEEIIESIGVKRPDLFNPHEYNEMHRNWLGMVASALFVLLIVSIAALSVIDTQQWFFALFFLFVGAMLVFILLSSPHSITMEGDSLLVRYLFGQKTVCAQEINSIELHSQRSRQGKNYFILLDLGKGKSIRVTGMGPSLPIAYLALKNWHQPQVPSGVNRDIV